MTVTSNVRLHLKNIGKFNSFPIPNDDNKKLSWKMRTEHSSVWWETPVFHWVNFWWIAHRIQWILFSLKGSNLLWKTFDSIRARDPGKSFAKLNHSIPYFHRLEMKILSENNFPFLLYCLASGKIILHKSIITIEATAKTIKVPSLPINCGCAMHVFTTV